MKREQGRDASAYRRFKKRKAQRIVDDLKFYNPSASSRPKLRKHGECTRCRGRGSFPARWNETSQKIVRLPCPKCKGSGRQKERDPSRERAKNREGLTWTEWLHAAGGSRGLFSELKMTRAWARGEDPSDWRHAAEKRRQRKRVSQDPASKRKARAKRLRARAHYKTRYRGRGRSASNANPEGGEGWRTHYAVETLSKRNASNLRRKKHGRDPGKRRIVHGQAHRGERTEHHAPVTRQELGPVHYELHWYSPEDRNEHVTDWRGPEAYGQAKREAEAYCDRSEAKRFIRLVRLSRATGRDPTRYRKRYRGKHGRARVRKSSRRRSWRNTLHPRLGKYYKTYVYRK